MVIQVRAICWQFPFILCSLHTFEGYMPVDKFLSEAEPTLELRDHILAYDPEKIEHFYDTSSKYYLRGVQNLVRLSD